MLELYRNIKKYRIQMGLSQDELAKKAGYTDRSSIAKIEKGLVDLPQSKIALFAKIFDVDPGILMGNGEEQDEAPAYYADPDARELAQFLFEHPEYKVLFDGVRKVRKEDLEVIKALLEKFS